MTVLGNLRPRAILVKSKEFYEYNYERVFEAILSLMRYMSKTILPYYNFVFYSVHSSFFAKTGSTFGRAHFLHNLCSQNYQQSKGVYLPCHTGLKLAALPKYWLFVAKSNSLIKKLGKCNATERNLLNGQHVLVALLIKLHTNAHWCCQK